VPVSPIVRCSIKCEAQDVHPEYRSLNYGLNPGMATCPGQSMVEATRGNGYAAVRGTLVVMIIIK